MKTMVFTHFIFVGLLIICPSSYAQSEKEQVFNTTVPYVDGFSVLYTRISVSEQNLSAEKVYSGQLLQYRRSRVGKKTKIGALIGLGAGGLAGGITGAVLYKECNEAGFMACFLRSKNRGDAFVNGAIIGGTLGVITGIIIGVVADSKKSSRPSISATIRPPQNNLAPRKLNHTVTLKFPIGK